MAIRDSWAVHRERMRLTMVRINVMVRQALYVLALVASLWSPNTARWDFGTYEIATQ